MYNLLIGGVAGRDIETTAAILEKILNRYSVFAQHYFRSRAPHKIFLEF